MPDNSIGFTDKLRPSCFMPDAGQLRRISFPGLLMVFLVLFSPEARSQNMLNNIISLQASQQPVGEVLDLMSSQGHFYFSYNSALIRQDSLVTLSAHHKTVRQALDMLFRGALQYRENGRYIILKPAGDQAGSYTVSGYILDKRTGEKISNASVYESRQLISTLTDDQGFFRLRLKDKYPTADLTVSKNRYTDTSLAIISGYDQEFSIAITPIPSIMLRPVVVTVDKTWLAKFLLSSRQRIQSLNINKFFTDKPFQYSLIPGVGTHGKLSAQVLNKFSFNILGGYGAGVSGFELGGLFNIDKKDVQHVQIGGIFNMVGGQVKGLQIAGIYNQVLDSVRGWQVGGVGNVVKGSFSGVEIGGIYNHVSGHTEGIQVAGIININRAGTHGVQIAGIFNYTPQLQGLQIGLVNIADTSAGYSLGLINIISKGYHKLSFSVDEVSGINLAFKTGNEKLYSILLAGMNTGKNNRVYSFGYGLGRTIMLNKKNTFSLDPELSARHLYLGNWDHLNLLSRLQLNLDLKAGKYISFFAGPSLAVYYSTQTTAPDGYKTIIPHPGYPTVKLGNKVTGWIGWSAGFNLF